MDATTTKLERVQELCQRRFRRALRSAVAVLALCAVAAVVRPDRWMRPALIVSAVAAAVFSGVVWSYSPTWKLRRAGRPVSIPEAEALGTYRRCVARDVTLTSIAAPVLGLAVAAAALVSRGLNVYSTIAAIVSLTVAMLAVWGARRYARRAFEAMS